MSVVAVNPPDAASISTPDRRASLALAGLSVAAFTFITYEQLPIALSTPMAADLQRSVSQVGLLVTGYAVAVALGAFPLTRISLRMPSGPAITVVLALFAAGNGASAVAPSYGWLLGARLVAALAHALFWALVIPVAARLNRSNQQGRGVARVLVGPALAPVIGVPSGAWLAQHAGWRAPVLALTAIEVLTCIALRRLLPPSRVAVPAPAPPLAPDRRRYALLLTLTTAWVAGVMTAMTFLTPFAVQITRIPVQALGPVWMAWGLAGVLGTVLAGRGLDRFPRGSLALGLTAVAAALIGLHVCGPIPAVAFLLVALLGLGCSATSAAVQNRTLHVAPSRAELASAGINVAFNVGTALGSVLGAALLPVIGLRSLPLVGAAIVASAWLPFLLDLRMDRVCRAVPFDLRRHPSSPGAKVGTDLWTFLWVRAPNWSVGQTRWTTRRDTVVSELAPKRQLMRHDDTGDQPDRRRT
jgi:predicted MFS family arabinose efflux permease